MDKISKERRSRNMSHIRGTNTKPEISLRKALYSAGLRYRIFSKLPGKPDVAFIGKKVAIFVNGCFWHGHGCALDHNPRSNVDFWRNKISNNKKRDEINFKKLHDLGWKVLVFWECEILKNKDQILAQIQKVVKPQKKDY